MCATSSNTTGHQPDCGVDSGGGRCREAGWRHTFKSFWLGDHSPEMRGRPPDWAFIGQLCPTVVLVNLLLSTINLIFGLASAVSWSACIGSDTASVLIAWSITARSRSKPTHSRTRSGALTSAVGTITKFLSASTLATAATTNGLFGPVICTAVATVVLAVAMHLVRELLLLRCSGCPGTETANEQALQPITADLGSIPRQGGTIIQGAIQFMERIDKLSHPTVEDMFGQEINELVDRMAEFTDQAQAS
jgi:hypothetical protein